MKKLLVGLLPLSYLLLLLFQKDLAMVGDLGRHLQLGGIVLQCRCVPQTNVFSYTHPNFPIVNHEWLAEVFLYLISAWFGLSGLLVFKMVLISTAAVLIYLVAVKKGSLFWVTIFSLLSITIFSMRFFVLPELFSYVFIALFIVLIERFKETKKMYLLWFLVPIEMLWVNMHIYFILGVVMYGVFLLQEIFLSSRPIRQLAERGGISTTESRIMNQEARDEKDRVLVFSLLLASYFLLLKKRFLGSYLARNDKMKFFIIGAFLVLATLTNPSFIRGALLPFTFSANYGFPVEENMSPFVVLNPSSTNSNVAYTLLLQVFVFELLIGIFVICLFIKKQWREIFHMGNGITAAILGVKFTRCISLFGLFGCIPLAQSFTWLEGILKDRMENSMINTIKGAVVVMVAVIIGIHIKGLIGYNILQFGFAPSAENAVTFIKGTHLRGRIFNNYIIGNYLIYGLYPQERVYVDARPEAYPSSFFTEYWRMMADPQFFSQQVKRYNINAIVFNVVLDDPAKIRPFLLSVLHSPDWVPVYADGIVTILVRNNEVNKGIIEKYRIKI